MDLKHISRGITDGRDRAPARAMFKSIGFTDSDLQADHRRGQHLDRNHAMQLSPAAAFGKMKEGIRAAGGTPMEFNTIAICDGETMGTEACALRW